MRKPFRVMTYVATFCLALTLGVAADFRFPFGPFYDDPLAVTWNASVGEVHHDLRYGTPTSDTYDLALPADTGRQAYGLVVSIHGGGYMNGDKSGDERYLKYFTSRGYVSAAINYTLDTDGQTSDIPRITREVKASIPAIVAEARRRGYPIDQMALIGGSAGAHLAMTYAYRDGDTAPVPVRFVVNMVGPSAFEPDAWHGFGAIVHAKSQVTPSKTVTDGPTVTYQDPAQAQAGATFLSRITGTTVTAAQMTNGSYRNAIKDISPYLLARGTTIPSINAYGMKDRVLPSSMEGYLRTTLTQAPARAQFINFSTSGHALQNDPDQWTQLFHTVEDYLADYMPVH